MLPQKLYSRTTFSIDALILSPPKASDYIANKPDRGRFLWASGNISSGDEIKTEWDSFVESTLPGFRGKYSYLFEITPNWDNVLRIHSKEDYINLYYNNEDMFTEYRFSQYTCPALEYPLIANRYSGLYVSAPELYSNMSRGFIMFPRKDKNKPGLSVLRSFNHFQVETLVVWDEAGINKLKMYHVEK